VVWPDKSSRNPSKVGCVHGLLKRTIFLDFTVSKNITNHFFIFNELKLVITF